MTNLRSSICEKIRCEFTGNFFREDYSADGAAWEHLPFENSDKIIETTVEIRFLKFGDVVLNA
jgi:hypothetical protein